MERPGRFWEVRHASREERLSPSLFGESSSHTSRPEFNDGHGEVPVWLTQSQDKCGAVVST